MNILTHKTAISPPFIPDAFPSKNANRAYNQSVCFCARSNCNSIFPFTGKELDPLRLYLQSGELCRARLTSPLDLLTGYSYFGARYLDHELMTGWLSVDPMADKCPSIIPYAYFAWIPAKLVDPDGREVYVIGDGTDFVVNDYKLAT